MELLPSFDIEHRFSRPATLQWMNVWWTQCFYVSAIYLVLVHWGQWMMKDRKRFVLRRPLFLWNLMLAVFSAIGFWKVGGQFIRDLQRYGWHNTICRIDYLDGENNGLWCFLFGYSKFPELIDTIFVVLRKQKLILLHWYHHVTVYCYCWHAYIVPHGQGRMFIVMNFLVHAVMYTYYAIRAQGFIRIPRYVNIGITGLQLLQMLIGIATFVDATWMLMNGYPCTVQYRNILYGMLMYFSYAILFGHFFFTNYVKKEKTV